MSINNLEIRNNAQMLMAVSSGNVETWITAKEGKLAEEFALQFDGYLLAKPTPSLTDTRSNGNECSQYDYNPAISSNTIHHKEWLI